MKKWDTRVHMAFQKIEIIFMKTPFNQKPKTFRGDSNEKRFI